MNVAGRNACGKYRLPAGACALALSSFAMPMAHADPWIPAAGQGIFEPMLRYFSADQAFSQTEFGPATSASSQQRETQLRFTGSHGIGDRISIEYDLRGGAVVERHHHAGRTVTSRSSGLEDQEIGLNFGLRQSRALADSIAVNVVLPTGRATHSPALGAGKAAIEPDFELGLAGGRMFATLIAGARAFVDGAAVQMRTTVSLGAQLTPRFTLAASVFFVRTHQRQPLLPVADQGEIYNLLRAGAKLEYRPTGRLRHWRPFIGYEDSIAGKGIHAGRRLVIGCAIHY